VGLFFNKESVEMSKRQRKPKSPLEVQNPNAAGIDIGSREHWVAVRGDCANVPVKQFGTFTHELHQLANWLSERGVTIVAMESTGIYWVPL